MQVYFDDVMMIISKLHKKKKLKGYENRDMDVKLNKIK